MKLVILSVKRWEKWGKLDNMKNKMTKQTTAVLQSKQDFEFILKNDPKGKVLKAVCIDVFDRKMKELNKIKKTYVVGIKAHRDAPALWVDLKDMDKFLKSKVIKEYLKI